MNDRPVEPPRRSCPICRKPAVTAHHPFCSDRCRKVDLGRWFQGTYAIPAVDGENDDDEAATGDERG